MLTYRFYTLSKPVSPLCVPMSASAVSAETDCKYTTKTADDNHHPPFFNII